MAELKATMRLDLGINQEELAKALGEYGEAGADLRRAQERWIYATMDVARCLTGAHDGPSLVRGEVAGTEAAGEGSDARESHGEAPLFLDQAIPGLEFDGSGT